MKKHYLLLVLVAVLGIVFSAYQYAITLKTEIIDAANTKPNPGHSWSEMESDSDSIQINGQKITNVALPTSDTDVATKAYVDAAGGGTFSTCYILKSTTSGVACATGYTTIAHHYGNSTCWIIDNALGSTNSSITMFTMGAAVLSFDFALDHYTYGVSNIEPNWYDSVYHPGTRLCSSHANWGDSVIKPVIRMTINGTTQYAMSDTVKSSPQTLAVCCK